MLLNPQQSIYGAKRLVGRAFDSATVRQVKERFHYAIVEGYDGLAAVSLGPNTLALEEVQGIVLQECREMAESHLGQKVHRAVVTCPAYYSEPQREAVRRAGAMAGLKVERILNEPTAAALAYGMNRQLKKRVLVYDLGGGTFDATLMSIEGNVFEVLATGGDIFLGGVDFDSQVVDVLLTKYQAQHNAQFQGDSIAFSRITDAAERAKVALSERQSFDIHLPMLEMSSDGTPKDLKCTLTRAELEATCDDLVARTISTVQDVLLDAQLKPGEVDDIVLAGGMSRMPMVRKRLEALFKKPPHASVNADEAVALGAALYSGTVDKVSSVVLIDVVPMTIGVGMPGGVFKRIIERNTPLPVSKSFGVSTQEENQQLMELMIFQGEDKHVSANEFLGAVHIEGLPRGPKGAVQVAVTLSLDSECVLSVEARELRTRKLFKAKLATRFTSEEIAKRLGIEKEGAKAAEQKRGQELEKRAGGFWGRIKKVFGR
jgi:molecular chaperone DnaK